MFTERTSVGLDVHARSVAAAAIDGVTGELFQTRLTPAHDHIRDWLAGLPGPVAVTYEAGPTGFGLSRVLNDFGVRCVVAAPYFGVPKDAHLRKVNYTNDSGTHTWNLNG